ncbi:MAG: SMP-30/gluconolactonase/LRE family protein [Gemmatimonadales bacterium]|nr:SMP-30/gluconolactonase/LRE family protein [Gemmatimonadales bacterium]
MSRCEFGVPRTLQILLVVLITGTGVSVSGEMVPFDSNQWVGVNGELGDYIGQQCRTGSAYLPHIAFKNGIIEYDVLLDGSRGYPGITFRATSMKHYEHIYIRPHAGLRGDGMQYAPAFGPGSDWQLYHGEGNTASIEMPADRWIHIRVEILDRRARVFYDGGLEPVLVIDQLKHEPVEGPVAIRSAPNTSARFANFKVTKTDDLDFPPVPATWHPRGLITEWELSQSFKLGDVEGSAYPNQEVMKQIDWQTATAESNGLLNISRFAQRSPNGEGDVVFARLILEADRRETRKFSFGYSDYVTVFLNGEPLFSGNNAYRSRNNDHPGVISLEDQVHLHLKEGKNELLFAVAEGFGGWGLMGQDNEADYFHPNLTRTWRLEQGNRMPESVVYDSRRGVLYVTNYFQGGNEFISRIGMDGEVLQKSWIGNLQQPTGMWLENDRLWVVQRRHLAEIDVEQGKILETHPIPGAVFPNDVTVDQSGNVFVTDTAGNKIYRFHEGEFEVWLEGPEVRKPNGILVEKGRLLFGNSEDGCLQEVNLADKSVRTLISLGQGANIDGLRPDGNGGFIVSAFQGMIYHVAGNGALTEILNTTSSGNTSADLEYIPEKELLIVPGLFDNRLTAYKFTGI